MNLNVNELRSAVLDAAVALQTAQDNLAFAKLSKAGKRVHIAKDVIAQIKTGAIKPTEQMYITGVTMNSDQTKVASCNACALGGCVCLWYQPCLGGL